MAQIWQNMAAKGMEWHRYGKAWQLLLTVRDARMSHNPSSHQERGCASSISLGQETGLIAKLKTTESLSVHLSLDVSRLNKYGPTGLQVKRKDVKCSGLQEWGGFAPLKSRCLNFTSSLISLIWDHHHSAIFSFGQMHIDHFQKLFFFQTHSIFLWYLQLTEITHSFWNNSNQQVKSSLRSQVSAKGHPALILGTFSLGTINKSAGMWSNQEYWQN